MREYLQPGRYCDAAHPAIRGVAAAVAGDDAGERARAVRLFRFVRDQVRYAFGPWGIAASETLARGHGSCSNKNNLLVALLRSVGIPAACGVLRVNAQEYFGALAPPAFKPRVSALSTHVYAAAFLDGRWVRCDASTDREIAEKTAHFCAQTRLLEWDGHEDAMDAIAPQHIHADLGIVASSDDVLDRAPRNASAALCDLLNDYVAFIRAMPRFDSARALMEAYFGRSRDRVVPA